MRMKIEFSQWQSREVEKEQCNLITRANSIRNLVTLRES